MLSLTSEYVLQAMIYLAGHVDEWPIPGREIARETGIPPKYLSNILGDLVRIGILDASPGKSGGFRMVRPPESVYLYEVLQPFEPVLTSRRPCPFGNEECSDDDPCIGHDRWKPVREAFTQFVQETSIHDVAVKQSRRRRKVSAKRAK